MPANLVYQLSTMSQSSGVTTIAAAAVPRATALAAVPAIGGALFAAAEAQASAGSGAVCVLQVPQSLISSDEGQVYGGDAVFGTAIPGGNPNVDGICYVAGR